MVVAVLDSVGALRAAVAGWRGAGERVALVPTMGALHEGHVSLVHLARAQAERVVVSIFVNPTQFAPTEDFSKYPRTMEADLAKLEGLADAVYAPPLEAMYPPGEATAVVLEGPAIAGLEDRFRPTHFRGVATVCAKLFIQANADIALFGEKDFQQVKVVTRMARDLSLSLEIVPAPTIREADGLALSSRNVFLSAESRAKAPLIHRVLQDCAAAIRSGAVIAEAEETARTHLAEAGFAVDYVEARNAETLARPTASGEPLRLLVAATLGATRLIDNIAV